MGVSIELYKLNFKKFKEKLMSKYPNNIKNEKLLEKIMLEFGTLCGDNDFIILHNEYYEGCICTWNMIRMIEEVFKLNKLSDYDDCFGVCDVLYDMREELVDCKEINEAYNNLNLERKR